MKKLIVLFLFASLAFAGNAQKNKYSDLFVQADRVFINQGKIELSDMQTMVTFATPIRQGLFKTVSPFPTQKENDKRISLGENPLPLITHKILVRLDAAIAVIEVNYNKVDKLWSPTPLSAIGPAIGVNNYIPTSETDPTPKVNYGASLGFAFGRTIYDPQLAEAKAVLAINIWQYFKFGGTYTFNPPTDIAKLGFFFGGGITF